MGQVLPYDVVVGEGDQMTDERVYEILAVQEPFLREKMEKLAKAAKRLGVPAPEVVILKRETRKVGVDGQEVERDYITYTVTGLAPKVAGGYQLLAVINGITDGANIVQTAPLGREGFDPTPWLTAALGCDYCGKNRRRGKTLVFRGEDGVIKQVGFNCARGFFGYQIPEVWELWGADVTVRGDEGLPANWTPAKQIVVLAFAAVAKDGRFIPRTGFNPTGDQIWKTLDAKKQDNEPTLAPYVTDEVRAEAQKAIDWLLAQDDATNQFLWNLRLAYLTDNGRKYLYLLAALPKAYGKAMQPAEVATAEPKVIAPIPFGKTEVVGTVTNVTVKETDYGTRLVMTVLTDGGYKVWGTVPANITWVDEGYRVRFTATLEPTADGKPDFAFFKRPTKAEILDEPAVEVTA